MSRSKEWQVLGNLSQEQFLRRYWQKKPLLLKGALTPFPSLITPDELAGMCCEEKIESRLIMEKGGSKPWELKRGPFKPSLFKKLPKSHWTILVNGVDRFIPDVHKLLDQFSFIPFWRMDDIMISYAVDQGNVGAHVDNFDVFLVQAAGRRTWMIEDAPRLTDEYVPDLPIRLLKKFRPSHTWVLEPGDVLYLPPRFPHHGIAQGDGCMTISVGFRAPTFADLINSAMSEALCQVNEGSRYSDPDLLAQSPGEISPRSVKKIRSILAEVVTSEEFLSSWMGRFTTEPYSDVGLTQTRRFTADQVRKALSRARSVVRAEGCRLAYFRRADDTTLFFVNGSEKVVRGKEADLATLLSDRIENSARDVEKLARNKGVATLCADLLASGAILLEL